MKQNMIILLFTLVSFVPLSIAIPPSVFYPEDQMGEFCQTPRYEDGKCVRISYCRPENRFQMIGRPLTISGGVFHIQMSS